MPDYLVIAVGGNAIQPGGTSHPEEDSRRARELAAEIAELAADGYRLVITHGNGPQVGEIMLRSEAAGASVPPLSLDEAGASSQGEIGYLLQREIGNHLDSLGRRDQVVALITQVVVAAEDPAFLHPTKPIGRFYSRSEAEALRASLGWVMIEDAGRGYRRVVPSPAPRAIVESRAIEALSNAGVIVIAAGGGGIPVVVEAGRLRGVEAVIDKDRTAQVLATWLGARVLVLLTSARGIALNFGTRRERYLEEVSAKQLREYASAGTFAPGSMGPKVDAALRFLDTGGAAAIICRPRDVRAAIRGEAGTRVVAHDGALSERTLARGAR